MVETRTVGKSGLRVTSVGLGCNNFGWTIDEAASRAVVHKALDLGITLFDTADRYGKVHGDAETVLGKVLEGERSRVMLLTKFGLPREGGPPNNSRSFVLNALDQSLQRLRTDYIDIYMIHWPDPSTGMEELLRTLDDLTRSGKIRYIGCSNLPPWKIVESKWIAKQASSQSFIASENEYNLLRRAPERELLPALEAYGMSLLPYFPLASGLLTGKYNKGAGSGRLSENFLTLGDIYLTEENLTIARNLEAFAAERGKTLLELAISWLLSRPSVPSVIAGATRPQQLEQNVEAATWKLSDEDLSAINQIAPVR